MSDAEFDTAVGWARAEGWNPGLRDAACFRSVDPGGFVGGYLDGEMVASISIVNYGAAFAFLGFYIVAPAHRGLGLGLALWQGAFPRAGDRLVGLDGVPAQLGNYQRSGFVFAYRNVRYGGIAPWRGGAGIGGDRQVVPAGSVRFETLAAYDRLCFPAERETFLRAWLGAGGHHALAVLDAGSMAGYGVIRPCHEGHKIGPLFADDAGAARMLFDSLTATLDTGGRVFLDVPEANPDAVALADAMGLEPVFETARMYTGPSPTVALPRIFGVTTFELG